MKLTSRTIESLNELPHTVADSVADALQRCEVCWDL